MKAVKVFFIILGIALVVVGICLSMGAFSAANNSAGVSQSDSAMTFVQNTYELTDDFSDISISENESHIRFLPAEDGVCKVVCEENEKIFYLIEVVAGTLYIESVDNRDWLDHIGIFFDSRELIVYLPKSEYDSLAIENISGSTTVPEGFSFAEVDIESTSGSIKFFAESSEVLDLYSVSGSLKIENCSPKTLEADSNSGSITISSVGESTALRASSVSGSIKLTDCRFSEITANNTSGSVTLENTVASGHIRIETVSGSITLNSCDGKSLLLISTSGSIKGTLLTEKIFDAESVSGSIDVPYCSEGGSCDISTISGGIHIKILSEEQQ